MSRTGQDMAKKLQDHRPLLIGCEAIGWLHMTGKAHPDFLREQGGSGMSYRPTHWHQQLKPSWRDRLDWLPAQGMLRWPNSLEKFLEEFEEGSSLRNLIGCLQAGHAMASGIEKNIPRKPGEYLRQDTTHMWIETVFGHPVRNLLSNPPRVLRPGGWERLLERIGELLDTLKELGRNPMNKAEDWWQWREGAIGREGWLREAFESTLAETRVPNNDVTLWDQSYVAAALFKAAAAGLVLLDNPSEEIWADLKSETRWRVLTVGFGTEHYEARAVRIGDWTGARQVIQNFFEQVRRLIEVKLAVGSLLYRDEQILAFTFPGQRFDDEREAKNRSLDDVSAEALRAWIQGRIDAFAKEDRLETPPVCQLSKRSTRSFIPMAREVNEVRKGLAAPVHRKWEITETEKAVGNVCPVCLARFNGRPRHRERSPKQRPCEVCYGRRRGRLDKWLQESTDTIWITEVADNNDRVAMISLSFDLDPWLNASYVDSLRTQSVAEWRRFNSKIGQMDNPIDIRAPLRSLTQYVQSKLGPFDKSDPVLGSLQEGYRKEKHGWESFFEKVVEDRSEAPGWNDLQAPEKANWLVHQLFRKNASPGRVHRFWRTAERFFDELIPAFREAAAAEANRWRTKRMLLRPEQGSQNRWLNREIYATWWNDSPLELLYLNENDGFLTICNLARVLQSEQHKQELENKTFELKGEDGKTRTLRVELVSKPDRLGSYAPLIVVDRSPTRFRVLVPLSAASACIESAVRKWEVEFSRVWDRMPLRAGIVAFPRMTPFQAVIEMARNMEDDLARGEEESWQVLNSYVRDGIAILSFKRPDGVQERVKVPVVLPDGRPDAFYPHAAATDAQVKYQRDFLVPSVRGQEAQVYRHAADLVPGDGVCVAPSRLGVTFLDGTARRFEAVDTLYLSDWRRIGEIWELLLSNNPSMSTLRNAWAVLAETKERWSVSEGGLCENAESWRALSRSVLANELDAKGEDLEVLVEAAVSGLLERTLDWHLRILKLGLEGRR